MHGIKILYIDILQLITSTSTQRKDIIEYQNFLKLLKSNGPNSISKDAL